MSYASDKALWLKLEELKAYKPSGRCGHCAIECAESLCAHCDRERVGLLNRFGGRAGSSNPRRKFSAPREEWTPYKESEDRR